jgi:Rrf2 family nitric oxide-sensitive transcriptional repressor
MVLKTQTDYALRTLIYLAHADAQAPVEAIAEAYRISKEHLVKVVQQLVRLGYLTSRPGRGGGIRLAVEPAAINCGKVVAEFEGRNGLLPCVRNPTHCVLEPGCVLRRALVSAEDAMYAVLDHLTVADLLRHNGRRKQGGVYNLTVRGMRTSAAAPRPGQ